MPEVTPEVRRELVSNGRIRVGINYGNAILAAKDLTSGESHGVAIDLAREIGAQLDAPLDIVSFDSAGAMVDGAAAGAWDIAFLGSDPARERVIDFTAAYLEIEATYLVPAASPLHDASEVDRTGLTISAPARANYELYLARTLAQAKLVSAPSSAAALDLLTAGQADALAGLTQDLIRIAERLPQLRLLDGHFMGVQQSIAVPKGRAAALRYLKRVVEDAKASGLVARAIERTGARGVSVAPPTPV